MNLISRLWSSLRRLTRRVADLIADCNWAQQRLGEVRMDPERYVMAPDHKVPETYTDFLLRTAGLLRHEPTARERAQGRRQLR
jgi:hypothetical protein